MSIPIFLADYESSSCQFVDRGTGTCWWLFVYILFVVFVVVVVFFFIVWFFVAHTVQFKVTSTNIIVFSKNLHFLIYLYNVQFMFCLLRLALSISHRFDKDSFLLIFGWGVFAHLGIITCCK